MLPHLRKGWHARQAAVAGLAPTLARQTLSYGLLHSPAATSSGLPQTYTSRAAPTLTRAAGGVWMLHRKGSYRVGPRKPLPSKVLVANRGEIACRVMRTCARLGIRTVAVYSAADRQAAHVAMADEAYCIGPAPSAESYLRMDRIIEVCKASGAEMVHPGYGFLSENADFAQQLAAAGIKFIGPPADAIVSMGSKSASKDIMTHAGVPCVPGYHGSDQSDATLEAEASRIGYPVLIKAVKGGGGKGMKIVERPRDFTEQLQSARREATTSFGDGDVLIERYLTKPRHVEVQIVSSGSPHNEHVAISTRDCSVQRRHQKIIEEAPAPHLSPDVEGELCAKATAAAAAVGYEGAGTVEFILDADTSEAWFLECNTRLQVEHPVSEMVSGVDLVEWQLEAACGNPLPLKQSEIKQRGHAFEARIYAEDTRANFLPDVGHLAHVAFPAPTTTLLSPSPLMPDLPEAEALASIRVDTGVATGDEVSVYYDPMIAKLIVHGRDRQDALRIMRAALARTHIVGPQTNVGFLTRLCEHPSFIDGSGLETGFIPKYKSELIPPLRSDELPSGKAAIQAAIFMAISASANALGQSIKASAQSAISPWIAPEFTSFRNTSSQPPSSSYMIRRRAARSGSHAASGDASHPPHLVATVTPFPSMPLRVHVDISGKSAGFFDAFLGDDGTSLTIQHVQQEGPQAGRQVAKVVTRPPAPSGPASTAQRVDVFTGADGTVETEHIELDIVAPTWMEEVRGSKTAAKGSVIAPMPSKVVDVRVAPGQHVNEGDVVVVLEAMKTEHTLRAPKGGIVARVTVEQGSMCAEGAELVLFEAVDQETAPRD